MSTQMLSWPRDLGLELSCVEVFSSSKHLASSQIRGFNHTLDYFNITKKPMHDAIVDNMESDQKVVTIRKG